MAITVGWWVMRIPGFAGETDQYVAVVLRLMGTKAYIYKIDRHLSTSIRAITNRVHSHRPSCILTGRNQVAH